MKYIAVTADQVKEITLQEVAEIEEANRNYLNSENPEDLFKVTFILKIN